MTQWGWQDVSCLVAAMAGLPRDVVSAAQSLIVALSDAGVSPPARVYRRAGDDAVVFSYADGNLIPVDQETFAFESRGE